MKRIISSLLVIALLATMLSGCNKSDSDASSNSNTPMVLKDVQLDYSGLDDEVLLRQIEDEVYNSTVEALNSTEYVVENVSAVYISKEYIDEMAYNSQSNVYFGYTLSELNELFQGTKYVFTLDENGKTGVKELVEIQDTSQEEILKNAAFGTGVILVCVVVSTVSAGAGAPACAAIFAASAKTGAIMAVSGAAFGGVTAGITRGLETGDMNEAVDAALLAGSESFKWGAISGACIGGGKEAFALKAATKGGLTMNEVAMIQKESKLPMDVISQLHSVEEYEIYKQAGLKTCMVNGKTALVQNIDLKYTSELADGTKVTNRARMQKGMAPIDPATGKAYELHHIGQNPDGTLAMLTRDQHRGKGVFSKLHEIWKDSSVDHGTEWEKTTREFWKYLGQALA